MVILLDSTEIPRQDRVGAIHDALMYASVPSHVNHEDPLGDVHVRMSYWQLGSANLFAMRSTGIRLTRTPRQLRIDAPERVAIAVQAVGQGRYTQDGGQRIVDTGEMMLMDLTAPYDFSWSGNGASQAFQVDYDQLDLPVEVVRKAASQLRLSPLYGLVHGHLNALNAAADSLGADPAASILGNATTELVRALIVSAAGDETTRRVMAETLLTRVTTYLRQHLTDPDLSADRIAHEHNISTRHLYKLWADSGVSMAQWIIAERLEGARHDLAKSGAKSLTIAAIARRWGFADAAHFSRRFRDAYQLTPREWRELRLSQDGSPFGPFKPGLPER